jgi:hypothetical protein
VRTHRERVTLQRGRSLGGHWVVTGWSPGGHWAVTRRSLGGHWVVTGPSLGGHWAVTGQSLGSHWAVTGQSLGLHWAVTSRSLVGHWAVTGQSLGSHWAVTGQSLGSHWSVDEALTCDDDGHYCVSHGRNGRAAGRWRIKRWLQCATYVINEGAGRREAHSQQFNSGGWRDALGQFGHSIRPGSP